jgi:acyl-CoA synthetase (AMP-forming)/AMP-acid ligase II
MVKRPRALVDVGTLGRVPLRGLLDLDRVRAPFVHELVTFLRAYEIATYKLPERLEVLDAFPLSPIGKVSKKDLVAQFAEEPRP